MMLNYPDQPTHTVICSDQLKVFILSRTVLQSEPWLWRYGAGTRLVVTRARFTVVLRCGNNGSRILTGILRVIL